MLSCSTRVTGEPVHGKDSVYVQNARDKYKKYKNRIKTKKVIGILYYEQIKSSVIFEDKKQILIDFPSMEDKVGHLKMNQRYCSQKFK